MKSIAKELIEKINDCNINLIYDLCCRIIYLSNLRQHLETCESIKKMSADGGLPENNWTREGHKLAEWLSSEIKQIRESGLI
jgi:hypothetical protein